MELNQYVKDAIRTESTIETVETDIYNLIEIMKSYVAVGNLLDDMKKNIFYGKPIDPDKWNVNRVAAINHSKNIDSIIFKSDVSELNTLSNNIDTRLFHAIVGIATESTELIEAVLKSIETGQDIDIVNVREEWGDLNWYGSILVDSTESDWNSILETNIAKLRKRYPEKFTTESAINRDLIGERTILEQVIDNLPN